MALLRRKRRFPLSGSCSVRSSHPKRLGEFSPRRNASGRDRAKWSRSSPVTRGGPCAAAPLHEAVLHISPPPTDVRHVADEDPAHGSLRTTRLLIVACLSGLCDAGCDRQHTSADFPQCPAGTRNSSVVGAMLQRAEKVPSSSRQLQRFAAAIHAACGRVSGAISRIRVTRSAGAAAAVLS